MQTLAGQKPEKAVASPRKFTLTILLLFSLAGLIAGFAVGGFRSHTTTTGSTRSQVPVAQTTVTAAPTQQSIVLLDFPKTLDLSATTQKADGATSYSITIQAIDKQGKPVHASNITCKVWLVQQIPNGKYLNIADTTLKAFNNLSAPIQGTLMGAGQPASASQPAPEIPNSLMFSQTTPQTAPCKANGQMTWTYTIAPTVAHGNYDLVLLTDWQGVHYNWGWDAITIQ